MRPRLAVYVVVGFACVAFALVAYAFTFRTKSDHMVYQSNLYSVTRDTAGWDFAIYRDHQRERFSGPGPEGLGKFWYVTTDRDVLIAHIDDPPGASVHLAQAATIHQTADADVDYVEVVPTSATTANLLLFKDTRIEWNGVRQTELQMVLGMGNRAATLSLYLRGGQLLRLDMHMLTTTACAPIGDRLRGMLGDIEIEKFLSSDGRFLACHDSTVRSSTTAHATLADLTNGTLREIELQTPTGEIHICDIGADPDGEHALFLTNVEPWKADQKWGQPFYSVVREDGSTVGTVVVPAAFGSVSAPHFWDAQRSLITFFHVQESLAGWPTAVEMWTLDYSHIAPRPTFTTCTIPAPPP